MCFSCEFMACFWWNICFQDIDFEMLVWQNLRFRTIIAGYSYWIFGAMVTGYFGLWLLGHISIVQIIRTPNQPVGHPSNSARGTYGHRVTWSYHVFMSFDHVTCSLFMLYYHGTWCYLIMLLVHVTCSCYLIMTPVHVVWSCHLIMLLVHAICSCYLIMSPVHVVWSCHLIMLLDHVAWLFCVFKSIVLSVACVGAYRRYHYTWPAAPMDRRKVSLRSRM